MSGWTHHEWHQPNDVGPHDETIVIGDAGTRVCFLTGMAGEFAGGGESVSLEIVAGNWQLHGRSQQLGVSAAVDCFDRSIFDQDDLHATVHNEQRDVVGDQDTQSGCWYGSEWPTGGEFAVAFGGIGGRLDGGAEYLEVAQSSDVDTPSNVYLNSCQEPIWGNATMTRITYGVGEGEHPVQFIGPYGQGLAALAGEFAASSDGTATVVMANAEQAVCYLTRVAGEFNGGGEQVAIELDSANNWVLETSALSGDGVWARARCMLLDQHCPESGCEQTEFDPPTSPPPDEVIGYSSVNVYNCQVSEYWVGVWRTVPLAMTEDFIGGLPYQGEGRRCPYGRQRPLNVALVDGMANTIDVLHHQVESCSDDPPSGCTVESKTYIGDHDGPVAELIVY